MRTTEGQAHMFLVCRGSLESFLINVTVVVTEWPGFVNLLSPVLVESVPHVQLKIADNVIRIQAVEVVRCHPV